jgi:hypothetical protein
MGVWTWIERMVSINDTSRLLKNDFSTTFSCENPNDFDGFFSKTWLFQHPASSLLKSFTGICNGTFDVGHSWRIE